MTPETESATTPEKTSLCLGYVPLSDCLPLVAAQQLGFFGEEGLQVTLKAEASWASLRDRLVVGQFDAAHMLAPMVLATSLGLGGWEKPLLTACVLNLNGNAVTVSRPLYQRLLTHASHPVYGLAAAQALAELLRHDATPLTFATVFPFSSHHYQLRYWLAAAGIDPDRQLRLLTLHPAQMADHLQRGLIDGYCVGEPWNSLAVAQGFGHIVATGHDIWQNSPEKVLAVTADWAARHPGSHAALLRAIHRAGRWLDENRRQAAALLQDVIPVPPKVLEHALLGELPLGPEGPARTLDDCLVFQRYAANLPWRSHARWLLLQMRRWNQLQDVTVSDADAIALACYRPDILRAAVGSGTLPGIDEKHEGSHVEHWVLDTDAGPLTMGPDALIDGSVIPE